MDCFYKAYDLGMVFTSFKSCEKQRIICDRDLSLQSLTYILSDPLQKEEFANS